MGILLCELNFRDVWIRNESVRAEIGQILHTDTHPHCHTHTTAAKLVVRLLLLDIAIILALESHSDFVPVLFYHSSTKNDNNFVE